LDIISKIGLNFGNRIEFRKFGVFMKILKRVGEEGGEEEEEEEEGYL
jgi:hypothetical protein